jgi:acetylornithine deacetylase/succinyl-diaminopimelate desuccinylase-like protein
MGLNEKKLMEYIRTSRDAYEKHLTKLVEIPTVSSDPHCTKEIQNAAALTIKMLKTFGLQAERLETPGHPIVIGSLGNQDTHPTVLIYNHLDVQPAELSQWDQNPFKLSMHNGHYGGRGTTDDKGPALTALFAAGYARKQGIPLNFRFVWEFEEEIGSPHFHKAISSRKKLLRSDSVLISDTVWISAMKPAIPYGIRGLLTATLHLETGIRDAHSGLVGGAARNPIGELCTLIERCYDSETGEVKIPGFYEDVLNSGTQELQDFLGSGFKVTGFKKAHGLKKIRFKETARVLDAIWSQPTFEVHGITGGYTGEGVKTVVPPGAEAKISMRLVPRQDPKKVFSLLRAFVKEINPDVKVKQEAFLEPYLASPKGEYLQAAVDAMTYGFQKRPALIREGGSIGAVVTLNRLFNVPVILLGLSLPEHGYHAPNEYFEWRQVQGGIRTFVHYFDRISRFG